LQLFFSIFFMLQTLFLDVADVELDVVDMCCWVLQTFFQCCRRCVSMLQTRGVGCCVEEKGKRLLMLDVARNTGRNMVAI
jgi:hypothetical protein